MYRYALFNLCTKEFEFPTISVSAGGCLIHFPPFLSLLILSLFMKNICLHFAVFRFATFWLSTEGRSRNLVQTNFPCIPHYGCFIFQWSNNYDPKFLLNLIEMVSFVKGKLSKLLSLALLILDIHDITIKKKNHHVYAQIVLNNFWTFLIRNGSKYITSK